MKRTGQTIREALCAPGVRAILAQLAAESQSRTALATEVCERFGFHDPVGKPRTFSCLKVLRDLDEAGHLALPPRLLDIVFKWRPRRLAAAVPEAQGVPGEVNAVCGLRLVLADPDDDEGMRTWNELIIRGHAQGERRLVGRQLRYLVESAHGWLGAIWFSAPAYALENREAWIGWDAEQRRRDRERLLNLSRFLIRPSVRCKNLASLVLGTCLRRVGDDFERRYGERPWLLETFIDTDAHTGTCFQAANWQRIGQTKGRGRNDRAGQSPESVKDIYVCPLARDFRERIGVPPDRGSYLRPRSPEQGLESQTWVDQEFGTVQLGSAQQ